MAVTGFIHHFGTFFLLVATVLLIITDITSPVVNDLGILKVTLSNATSDHYTEVSFGTFGYCFLNTADDDRDYCTKSRLGYQPTTVMSKAEGVEYSDAAYHSTNVLTKVMILHPIATGLVFIAFLLAIGAGMFGSLFAAATALLSFIVIIVALICDFIMFSIIKSDVNDDNNGSTAHAYYSAGIWCILAAAICSLLGAAILFVSCCSARMHKKRGTAGPKSDYGAPATRRRRFF